MYVQFRINTEPVTDALLEKSADESAPSSCIERKNRKVAGHLISANRQ